MLANLIPNTLQKIIFATCIFCFLSNSPHSQIISESGTCLELTEYSPSFDKGVRVWDIDVEKAEKVCASELAEKPNDPDIIFSMARIADASEDYKNSFRLYLRAAELGSRDAASELAGSYQFGYGVQQSSEQAIKWAKKAHELGSAQGSYFLGLAYRDGSGVISNDEKSIEFLEIASKRGSSKANIILAVLYAYGEGSTKQNLKKAEALWRTERIRGNDEALVDKYEFHLFNPKDPDDMASAIVELEVLAADGWYQASSILSWVNIWPEDFAFTQAGQVSDLLSVRKGFDHAMAAIDHHYFLNNVWNFLKPGIAEKLTEVQAAKFLAKIKEISRSKNIPKSEAIAATMILAQLEYEGLFAPPNLKGEIEHLQFAANELGHGQAANSLSYTYREDPEVRNLNSALEFAELAIDSDNPYEQAIGYSNVGQIYAYSTEKRDFQKASFYFGKAVEILTLSEFTHDEAFLHLARILLLGGHGIQRDVETAKKLILKVEEWNDSRFYSYFLNRYSIPLKGEEKDIFIPLKQLFEEGRSEAASELAAFSELIGDKEKQFKWTFVCSIVCDEYLREISSDYLKLKSKGIRGDKLTNARNEAIEIVKLQFAKSGPTSLSLPVEKQRSSQVYEAGRLYALLIGNSNYQHYLNLDTPVKDIRAVGRVLGERYQASITYLENVTRSEIVQAFSNLNRKVGKADRVLIYFAGHGELVEDEEEGYWLPTDADEDNDANWISNSYVKRKVRALPSENVLIIADTCFSGAMTRGINLTENPSSLDAIQKFLDTKSRVAISSGGLKPVLDGFGGDHSIFANELVKVLESINAPFTASGLYQRLRDSVTEKSLAIGMEQVPLMSNLIAEGHEGPDFVLLPD